MNLDLSKIPPVSELDPTSPDYVKRLESGIQILRKAQFQIQREIREKQAPIYEARANFLETVVDQLGSSEVMFFTEESCPGVLKKLSEYQEQINEMVKPFIPRLEHLSTIAVEYIERGCALTSIVPITVRYAPCESVFVFVSLGKKNFYIESEGGNNKTPRGFHGRFHSLAEKDARMNELLGNSHQCNLYAAENPVRNIFSKNFCADLETRARIILNETKSNSRVDVAYKFN